jgi:hypothetical protein
MAALTRIASRTDDESLPTATATADRAPGGPGAAAGVAAGIRVEPPADIVDQVSRKYGVFFLAGNILPAGKMPGATKEDPHHVRD